MDSFERISPQVLEVQKYIDVAVNGSGHYLITLKKSNTEAGALLRLALLKIPEGSQFSLDMCTHNTLFEETLSPTMLTKRPRTTGTLHVSEDGFANLRIKKFIDSEGNQVPELGGRWTIVKGPFKTDETYRPSINILSQIAKSLDASEKTSSRQESEQKPTARATPTFQECVEIISDERNRETTFRFVSAVSDDHFRELRQRLGEVPLQHKITVDFAGFPNTHESVAYAVMAAAKSRKDVASSNGGFFVTNLPPSKQVTRIFSAKFTASCGVTIMDTETTSTPSANN